ncbi:MAG: 50S ribosomal protein L6 [Pseudomonadota bacterium]
MSRIGKKPVPFSGATVTLNGSLMNVKGPKGELSFDIHNGVIVALEGEEVIVKPRDENSRMSLGLWGMTRTMISNMVEGVTKGFERNLELVGVGYRAAMNGPDLELSLGYSHPVIYKAPKGVVFATPKPTEIKIAGIDKQQLGQIAAEIRAYRPPEPYKGKGVRYSGETVRRKEGKKK